MNTDTQREAFRKEFNELTVWRPDTRGIVPPTANEMRFERAMLLCDRMLAALSQQPVGEEELMRVIYCNCSAGLNGDEGLILAKALLARFNISDRGK